jgi:hypothetical protein
MNTDRHVFSMPAVAFVPTRTAHVPGDTDIAIAAQSNEAGARVVQVEPGVACNGLGLA